eukprot:CAMPEP_0118926886 /NCGR_PEP_ID=MMETSP1169-20130426/4498_1 /TAXON_ID=36882 /ORGANISM="Pyramimonas obovata, Strain CCMP722" /LENGTH=252 /DNA_ID=CAMNT_0006868537 /DNA_START=282 /DNA_END=1037 /DNA_ORIENTATION=-
MACTDVSALLRPSATLRPLWEQGGRRPRDAWGKRCHQDIQSSRKIGTSTNILLHKAAVLWRRTSRADVHGTSLRNSVISSATSRRDRVTCRAVNNIVLADGKLNQNPPGGRIDIICGPMFSGKTTELLARVSAAKGQGKDVMLIKSAIDDRYSTSTIVTHDGVEMACFAVQSLEQLQEYMSEDELRQPQVIAIDEAQFFRGLHEFCVEAAEKRNQQVLIAGLDGDFQRAKFGEVLELVPVADTVTKLHARCE